MRKDVKLGMAIGGGLIAVLVGYLLFAPPTNKKGAQFANAGEVGSIIDQQNPGELTSTGATDPGATPTKGATPDNGPAIPFQGETKQADPAKPAKPAAPDKVKPVTPEHVVAKESHVKDAPSKPDVETLTERDNRGTPATRERTQLYFDPNDALGGGLSTDAVFDKGKSAKATPAAGHATTIAEPTDKPADPNTHVVKAGETLSSISLVTYGSSSYYPHILRANPGVNPNNLKLGTVLKLPKAEEFKAADKPTAADVPPGAAPIIKEETKIDPAKQWRVAQNDSLYKIAMKVYGKASYVDKIYERNKAAIGPNPTRLKLGMILDLPEKAPAAAPAVATPAPDATNGALSGGPIDNQPK